VVTIDARQRWRRRTAAQLTAENPTLDTGEPAFESDEGGFKLGPGAWNSRPYAVPYRGDITMQAPTVSGGTVTNGSIRRAAHVKVDWTYTQTTDPTDVAVGTGFLIDADVVLASGGGFGPQVQTGYFGPRGAFQFEGLFRYGQNLTSVALPAVGYGDFPTFANTAGAARTITGSWGFLSARSYLADGATVTLAPSDVNQGGAAFVDAAVYATVDTGTLNGTTNSWEHVSYYSMPGIGGNTSLSRRIGFDCRGAFEGMHPAVPEPTGAHWSGAGDWDATTPSLTEEIGLRIQPFTLGTDKIGIQTAHPIQLIYQDLTWTAHADVAFRLLEVPTTTDLTMNNAGGLVLGNDFTAYMFGATVIWGANSSSLGAGSMMNCFPTHRNTPSTARSINVFRGFWAQPVYKGDGAALSVAGHTGFLDLPLINVVNSGTVGMTDAIALDSGLTVETGGTVTTRRGVRIADATGAGTLTTQIGVDVAALAKGGTNIGIRNAATEVATPSVQTLTAVGNTITPNAKVKRLDNTSGGSLTLTSAPTIPDGQDGQILKLFNSSTQNVVLQDQGTLANSNLRLSATTITISPRDTVELMYSATVGDWIQFTPVVAVL
jgi:hypothetical protein